MSQWLRTVWVLLVWAVGLIVERARGDSLHPVRFPNEEEFFKAKTHERSMTVEEMERKIKTMRSRRKFEPWNSQHPRVEQLLKAFNGSSVTGRKRRPNILFMLADDLGYGDLSVEPFTTDPEAGFPCGQGGYLSRQLERMAAKGIVMTNFHSAAPVCSPARAAIMTGLYSWRMTAMNAFELGRDLSQRNGFLPQIPTVPEVLREYGYFTAHSGKWHLGGMREELRRDRVYHDKCARPSPNQHGFEEYVSELDGPESPRYTFLLQTLHTQGHHHLLKDDVPVPIIETPGVQNVLSDREANDAIDFIRTQHAQHPDQPWFVQVWFNAPHHPWQVIESGEALYGQEHHKSPQDFAKTVCRWDNRDFPLQQQQFWQYKTMIAAMDASIGRLLDAIESLGLEEDTLIVFTSDNGNEDGSGSGGIFKEGKRSLMEGGVRVPTLLQWKGVIPAGSASPFFAAHTDFFPTFLEAADIPRPPHLHFDGVSLLPILRRAQPAPANRKELRQAAYHVPLNVPGEEIVRQRLWQRYQRDPLLQHHVNVSYGFAARPLSNDEQQRHAVAWDRRAPSGYDALQPPRRRYFAADDGASTHKAPHNAHRVAGHHATNATGHNASAEAQSTLQRRRQLFLVKPKPSPAVAVSHAHHAHAAPGAHRPAATPAAHTHHNPLHAAGNVPKGAPTHRGDAANSDAAPAAASKDPGASPLPPAVAAKAALDEEYLEYLVSNRVYLWHKETDPYHQTGERMGSAGHFDHVKVIAQGRRGCIDRLFDLKHDPFEDRNLLAAPYNDHGQCRLSVYDVDGNAIRHALQSRGAALPLPEHCAQHATHRDACRDKYIAMVTFKVMIIVRKLLPFMRDGNHGHQLYMAEDADRAVCAVPAASAVAQMDFLRGTDCEQRKFGCSFPEYY